jgi:hypothetical protein
MPPEYEVPEAQKKELKQAYHNLQIAKDILAKLRTAGMPNAEAEARVAELEDRLLRFAAAFKIDLTEE